MAQKSDYTIRVTEKGAKKAEKNINGLNSSLGGLAKKAGVAAAGFFGARMLLDGFKQAINLSAQQELAEKKLEASLGRTSQALLDQASALQQQTSFGDEAIIEAQALIAAFTDEEETIKAATQATIDLAAAKGMDLVAAADLVSKSLGSSTNALSRYGIEVTGAVGSQERLETLTRNVGNLFGGQAAAQADTMSGAMEQASNAMGDAAENLGDLLAPTVISVARGFKGAAEAVGAFLGRLAEIPTEEALTSVSMETVNKALADRTKELSALNSEQSAVAVGMGGLTKSDKNRIAILESQIEKLQERKDLLEEMTEFERFAFAAEEERQKKDVELRDIARGAEELEFTNRQVRYGLDLNAFKKVDNEKTKSLSNALRLNKKQLDAEAELHKLETKNAAIGAQTAADGLKQSIGNASKKAIAELIASIFQTMPYPANLILAATAGGLANSIINRNLDAHISSFAEGGSFVTGGDQLIRVGDNPSGREIVNVTPLNAAGEPTGGGGMINVNISGNVMSENYTEDIIIPHIKEALRRGEMIQ